MTPEPGRIRVPPPIVPPAPPGTGGPPESGGGDNHPQLLYNIMVEGLNDLAVIRTSHETLAVFPDDADLQAEIAGIAEGARLALQIRLRVAEREFVKGEAEWAVETRRWLALIHAELDAVEREPEAAHIRASKSYGDLLMWLTMHGADPRPDRENH